MEFDGWSFFLGTIVGQLLRVWAMWAVDVRAGKGSE